MKRVAALTALLAIGVLACNELPKPAACTAATVLPPSSVVEDGADKILMASNVKTIDPTSIDAVETNRLLTDPTGLAVGDTIASNCNSGIIRKISKITNAGASGGLRPQDISKVYIETTAASLENAIQKGTAELDFGSLDFSKAEINPENLASGVSLGTGIRPQSVTLQFLNREFKIGAASVKVSGNLENNLQPRFNLKFLNNSVDRFEVGMKGSLKLNLTGTFTGTLNAINSSNSIKLLKKPLEYTRAFTLGAIPVVVVISLEPVIGYNFNVNGQVSATATVSPTLQMDYGIKYVKNPPQNIPQWSATNTPPSLAFNPSFNYAAQVTGTGEVFVKLLVGVKLYGAVGPEIENKTFAKVDFSPFATNPPAKITLGAASTSTLSFNMSVLGVGVQVSAAPLPLLNLTKGFDCTKTACAAQ
jgi:hypothetical protein